MTLEIDTQRGYDDYEQQIRELETHELIACYCMFESNPTPFQLISDELLFRKQHEVQLESADQAEQIAVLLGQ